MTFEAWWTEHEGLFTTPIDAARAAWKASPPPGRVPVDDPDYPGDANKTMWCDPCVVERACPHCKSAVGVPCKGAALFMPSGHPNGKRYVLTVCYKRKNP